MSNSFNTASDLVEISKLNGSFRRNYGKFLGAFLYLRSISGVQGTSALRYVLLFSAFSAAVTWLDNHGWLPRLHP